MKDELEDREKERLKKRMNQFLRRERVRQRIVWGWRGFLCFIGRFQKPREIVWEETYGGTKIPCCPRCHETVYYENRCCFCGLPFANGAMTIGKLMEQDE